MLFRRYVITNLEGVWAHFFRSGRVASCGELSIHPLELLKVKGCVELKSIHHLEISQMDVDRVVSRHCVDDVEVNDLSCSEMSGSTSLSEGNSIHEKSQRISICISGRHQCSVEISSS